MATKPMGQLGGTPRVVAIQPKCYPAQQVACLEFFPEGCQMGTSCILPSSAISHVSSFHFHAIPTSHM